MCEPKSTSSMGSRGYLIESRTEDHKRETITTNAVDTVHNNLCVDVNPVSTQVNGSCGIHSPFGRREQDR